jgi:hypothetical protein
VDRFAGASAVNAIMSGSHHRAMRATTNRTVRPRFARGSTPQPRITRRSGSTLANLRVIEGLRHLAFFGLTDSTARCVHAARSALRVSLVAPPRSRRQPARARPGIATEVA